MRRDIFFLEFVSPKTVDESSFMTFFQQERQADKHN